MTNQPEERLEDVAAEVAWVRRLAIAVASDVHKGEDIAQEALLAASASGTRRTGSWKTWLAGAVRRLHLHRGRSDADRTARERQAARPDLVHDATLALERLELQEALSQAVRELGEPYRSTILLRWYEGLEPSEIARRSGVPVRTVHTRITRALSMLRESLDRRSHGDRSRWMAAWLPLMHGASNPVKATIMGMQAKFVTAGVCAVALLALWLAQTRNEQPPKPPGAQSLALGSGASGASEGAPDLLLGTRRQAEPAPRGSTHGRTKRRLSEILTEIWKLPEDQDITGILDHEADSAVPAAILEQLTNGPLESRLAMQLLRMLREDAPSLAGHERALVKIASSPDAQSFRVSAVSVLLAQDTDAGRQGALELTAISIQSCEGSPETGLLVGATAQVRSLAKKHVPGTTALASRLCQLAGSPPLISFPEDDRLEGQVLPDAESARRSLLGAAYLSCAQMGDESGLSILRNAIAAATTPTEQSIIWRHIELALESDGVPTALGNAFQQDFVRILSGTAINQDRRALRAAILWAGMDPGRPELLLPLETQIAGAGIDVQGRWTRAIAEIALRTHDPACLAALARQAARPEFLRLEFESHFHTKAAAVKALVLYGAPSDFDLLANYATAGSDEVAKLLLESASSEQLAARPALIEGILKALDATREGSPSFARAIALQRLHDMNPLSDVLAKYASSDDYYQRLDADTTLRKDQYGAKTESERSAKLLELLRIIDAGEKISSRNAALALHDWIAGRMVTADAVAAAIRCASLQNETRLQLLFNLLAARDAWKADEIADSVQVAGESVFGTQFERRLWTMVIAYLTRDPSSWGWALDLVHTRQARSPAVEEALRVPLEELAAALAP